MPIRSLQGLESVLFPVLFVFASSLFSEDFKPNYDESKIPPYTLPDPLRCEEGTLVQDQKTWREKRRPELIRLFETNVYGKAPGPPQLQSAELIEEDKSALGGIATRRQIRLRLENNGHRQDLGLLIYLPNQPAGKVPLFLGLNFAGNHCVHSDPSILLPQGWVPDTPGADAKNHQASEKGRGFQSTRWQIEKVIQSGFGTATVYYGDIDPDFDDHFKNGVHALFPRSGESPAESWGSIAAWAWGLSRIMDQLESESRVDSHKVILHGHSRLGKTALWAGALDERFAIVISNNSGCGGAALSIRAFGETVGRINRVFPHWFCGNYSRYNENESAAPVDQHELIALMAPRPVYIASAEQDRWADPHGEFLAALGADPVYRLFTGGKPALRIEKMPPVDQPSLEGLIGYHIRSGNHDVLEYDWEQFIQFARIHLPKE